MSMGKHMNPWVRLVFTVLKVLAAILLLYSILRAWFLWENWNLCYNYYWHPDNYTLAREIIRGIYYDLIIILFINVPVILLIFLPLHKYPWYKWAVASLFSILNTIFLCTAVIDIYFYRYSLQRSSGAIAGMGSEFFQRFSVYAADHKIPLLVLVAAAAVLFHICRKVLTGIQLPSRPYLPLLLVSGILYLSIKPLWQPQAEMPIVTNNTPYSIVNSLLNDPLFFNDRKPEQPHYLPASEAESLVRPEKYYYKKDQPVKAKNVMVIILESFSSEFLSATNNGTGCTPFLDSLAAKSLLFTHAFANAKHSNEGIPAILASLPSLMKESFIISKYRNNSIEGIGRLLKEQGYTTAFFHGGTNGVYGFDNFSRLAGFDQYFGRKEYNNDLDYDGSWGIWDDRFFPYTAAHINDLQPPFSVVLYSLSSHHPFQLPGWYDPPVKEESPILQSIRYTDGSLRAFFKQISGMKWFANTLFIITSDHTANAESNSPFYNTLLGAFRIPFMFYTPDGSLSGTRQDIVQQIDILPSIIDHLNINKKVRSLGKSIFDTTGPRYTFQYLNNTYQVADSNYFITFNGSRVTSIHLHKADSFLRRDLLKFEADRQAGNTKTDTLLHYLQAVIQTYHHDLNTGK